jgi:hypothetical protein
MMSKYLLGLMVCWLMVCRLGAQTDIDTVGQIRVAKPERPLSEDPVSGDFIRRQFRHRIDLHHADNKILSGDSDTTSLVGVLLSGLRQGHLTACFPGKQQRPCTWADLLLQVARLQGLNPDTLDYLHPSQLDWAPLYRQVELVADEGFSARNSMTFFRVCYLRLYWCPEPGTGPCRPLLMITWPAAHPWLSHHAPIPGYPYTYWLETQRFHAEIIPVE